MFHSLQRLCNVHHRRLCQKQLYRFLCGFALLQKLLGQIHIAVIRYHLVLPDHGRQFLFDLAHGDAHLREGYPFIEQLHTMMSKESGGMGQNYLRSLLALGFQAFLIIVCVAIYAVLVQNIATESDIIMAIWSCVGYTVLLCFTLFKTGSLAKAVFNAH